TDVGRPSTMKSSRQPSTIPLADSVAVRICRTQTRPGSGALGLSSQFRVKHWLKRVDRRDVLSLPVPLEDADHNPARREIHDREAMTFDRLQFLFHVQDNRGR